MNSARQSGAGVRPPEIVVSQLGPNATVIGAIARALAMVAEQDGLSARPPRADLTAAQR